MLTIVLGVAAVALPCTAALAHAAHGNRQERRRLELARERS